jgi:NifU-like protein involved in Fe-S cluster formation
MDELPELLCSHYEDAYHRGRCERATHGAQSHDPETRHFILMQLRVCDAGIIEEAWFDSQGCIYCEAPASILALHCESKSIDEFMQFELVTYLELTQLDQVSMPSSCHKLAWIAFHNALRSTNTEYEDVHLNFGGPSLGEES